MPLAHRTSTAPKKPREVPEPETVLCKGAENIAADRTPMLGYCVECKVMGANSEADHLCLNCHKEAAGFEFDAEKLRWVKVKKEKK
jgi:hypothetical protein